MLKITKTPIYDCGFPSPSQIPSAILYRLMNGEKQVASHEADLFGNQEKLDKKLSEWKALGAKEV